MRLSEHVIISAPRQLVWDYVIEPANALHYMSGVTRWEVQGARAKGLGARYHVSSNGSPSYGYVGDQRQNQLWYLWLK